MINEEKVIMMTHMASFEKSHEQKDMNIVNYFRTDYIGFQVLKSIIAATLSFMAVAVVYLFYNFERLMSEIYNMDLVEEGKKYLTMYLVVVGVYAVICYFVYAYRYSKAKKELKDFYLNLRKLSKFESRGR